MIESNIQVIKDYSSKKYMNMTRKPEGRMNYPYIVPGSADYADQLWDWDSWFTDIAIRQIMLDNNDDNPEYLECEKGCILNFLEHALPDGRIPILIKPAGPDLSIYTENFHKPCLAQHICFIAQNSNETLEWIRPYITTLCKFIDYYMEHCRHEATGLYFWLDDGAIGVDNDPCTYYRPPRSSASVYLNCLMYKELLATVEILGQLGEDSSRYENEAKHLKTAMQELMWDERNGFYYSVDLNLLPIESAEVHWLHSGSPRHYDCLIQRLDVWSGFMAMWAGIATKEQAERMVQENLLNEGLFWAPYGVRSLSAKEKMYRIVISGNPSCWQGPIWGVANYICFRALIKYEFIDEAKNLAIKTICMYGQDIMKNGEMHEYYHPETGVGVHNKGFQSWNLLVNNMIAWLEGREVICEA